MNWIIALVFMIGLYQWTYRLAPEAAPLLTGLTMVNVTFWTYYRRTLAELAFVTAMIWTVNALNRALAAHSARERALYTVLGCGVAIYLSIIREVGALFAAAFVVAVGASIYNGRQRLRDGLAMAATVALPALLAVVVFVVYDQSTFEGSRNLFGTHLGGFLHPRLPWARQIWEGLRLQISAIGRLLVPGMFKAYGHSWLNVNTLLYLCVALGVLVGWSRIVRQNVDVFAYTLPLYFILYVTWGFDADTRYMLPMLPLFVMSVWYLLEPYRSWRLSALTALLILHSAVAIGYWTAVEIPRGIECNIQWSIVTRIVSATKSDPGQVATVGKIPECVRSMLSFAFDRPIVDINKQGAALQSSKWVIVPVKGPALLGFRQITEASNYRVLRNIQLTPITEP